MLQLLYHQDPKPGSFDRLPWLPAACFQPNSCHPSLSKPWDSEVLFESAIKKPLVPVLFGLFAVKGGHLPTQKAKGFLPPFHRWAARAKLLLPHSHSCPIHPQAWVQPERLIAKALVWRWPKQIFLPRLCAQRPPSIDKINPASKARVCGSSKPLAALKSGLGHRHTCCLQPRLRQGARGSASLRQRQETRPPGTWQRPLHCSKRTQDWLCP
jgi:hypothetical protein